MSDLRRCDECGKEAPASQGIHWLRLSRPQPELYAARSWNDHPGPWDFCSWSCLAAYAKAHVPISEGDYTYRVTAVTAQQYHDDEATLLDREFNKRPYDRNPATGRPWWQKLR